MTPTSIVDRATSPMPEQDLLVKEREDAHLIQTLQEKVLSLERIVEEQGEHLLASERERGNAYRQVEVLKAELLREQEEALRWKTELDDVREQNRQAFELFKLSNGESLQNSSTFKQKIDKKMFFLFF